MAIGDTLSPSTQALGPYRSALRPELLAELSTKLRARFTPTLDALEELGFEMGVMQERHSWVTLVVMTLFPVMISEQRGPGGLDRSRSRVAG